MRDYFVKGCVFLIILLGSFSLSSYGEDAVPKTNNQKESKARIVAKVLGKDISEKDIEPSDEMKEAKKNLSQEEYNKWITRYKKNRLTGAVFGQLLKDYTAKNKIEVTKGEIEKYSQHTKEFEQNEVKKWQKEIKDLKKKLKAKGLSKARSDEIKSKIKMLEEFIEMFEGDEKILAEGEKKEYVKADLDITKMFITRWKVNKSLYEKYGGRVIFQQAGVEPLDAYRKFLEEAQKNKRFEIYNIKLERLFWDYFTNEKLHFFYTKKDGEKFIKTPPWELEAEIFE